MQKIILYYKFVPVKDPEAVMFWQRSLARELNLKGRVIISKHGINGTLGGELDNLKRYVKETKLFPALKGTKFKWSEGTRDDFPRLSVKVRDEIVTFGVPDEVKVGSKGIVGGGKHIKPEQVHALVEKHGDEVVFFDGRNAYEAKIGRFKNAVVPGTRTTRDFIKEIEKPKYQELKDKPVVTYCTGGIRCEVLSTLMKNRGFKEVYQIDGGIVKYGEKYGDTGLWEGALHVFDGRMKTRFSEKSKDIGECTHCQGKTSRYVNCANLACNDLILVCEKCERQTACSSDCERQSPVSV